MLQWRLAGATTCGPHTPSENHHPGERVSSDLPIYYPLQLGQPLPTLPLRLAEDFAVPLELEASYEQRCRDLRIVG